MIRLNMNQWWIWSISLFLITNSSFAKYSSGAYDSQSDITDKFGAYDSQSDITDNLTMLERCEIEWSSCNHRNRLCYCDDLCIKFGDCCMNKNTTLITKQQFNKPLDKNLYTCKYNPIIANGIYTVIGCPEEYDDNYVRKQCEQPEKTDKSLHIPVYGVFPDAPINTLPVKFYNVFCAFCHELADFNYFKVGYNDSELSSRNERDENVIFETREDLRNCTPTIDECPPNENNHHTSNCTEGPFKPLSSGGRIYKNIHCAICNHVVLNESYCSLFLITNLSFVKNSSGAYDSLSHKTDISTSSIVLNPSQFPMEECENIWSDCNDKRRLCYCDDLCLKFGDCCMNKNTALITKQQFNKPLTKNLYTCTYDIDERDNFYMVIGCPVEYADNYIRKQCEQPEKTDKLLHVPVSGVFPDAPINTLPVKFYNFYCAICHGVKDYNFSEVGCSDSKLLGPNKWDEHFKCHLIFGTRATPRRCRPTIDECPPNENNHNTSNCTQSPFKPVKLGRVYKNKDCALCNHVDIGLFCSMGEKHLIESMFQIYWQPFPMKQCGNASIYDTYTEKCRPIYSPSSLVAANRIPTIPRPDCQLIKLDENEYSHFGDVILLQNSNQTINESLLYYENYTVYICAKDYLLKNAFANGRPNEVEIYITFFGVSLSMLALCITFSVYASFRSLRNLPGKMSMNLIASMFLANLLLVSSNFDEICTVVAVCMHYVYLVSFFWMNALSFDAWKTFSKTTVGGRNKHCFKYYSIYCWISPLLIVSVCIFVQFTPFDIFPSWLSPRYGPPLCWISSKWSHLIFFAVPLFFLILCNLVFYALTIRAIYRTKKLSNRHLSEKNKGMFLIYLKLCFIMGMNWLFALLHILSGSTIIGYISVFLNSFQGFWVGCSYLFSKQVRRQLEGKFPFLRAKKGPKEKGKGTEESFLEKTKTEREHRFDISPMSKCIVELNNTPKTSI